MSIEKIIIYFVIFLFIFLIFSNFYAVFLFKRNEKKYDLLLSEFKRNNLELDTLTHFSSFMGFFAIYQKIIYFVRLRKGVKMYRTKGVLVHKEAYHFMQARTSAEIKWILKLHKLYRIIFILTAFFFILLFALVHFFH
ncbi:hypothetical protein BG55_17085 [Erwinia mallotivora]|uniref:Universal stress protein B n=1 Tax=Erwinia mallotivora TaxID=69222 RepID=A0A014PUB1_9GAMM|nr:hypothetical protein BG55_17085 [Erwinia mallotivora]